MELQDSEQCTEYEAVSLVNNTIYNYYITAVPSVPVYDSETGKFSYAPNPDTGTIAYFNADRDMLTRYYGGNFAGVDGRSAVVTYQQDIDYYTYANGSYRLGSPQANYFWGHARYLYDNGLIYGAYTNYQCTYFAQMWLYDVYGINQGIAGRGSGHGGNFASVLIDAYPDMFEWGKEPTGGGIASVGYAGDRYGHVICIDETDYANNRTTYSEGNYDSKGGIRIRITCTFEQFHDKWPGAIWRFANPK